MERISETARKYLQKTPSRLPMLQIRVLKSRYAIALEQVVRVMSLVALHQVPGAPAWMVGIMSYQGESVIVADLAERLAVRGEEAYTLNTPIVLCRVSRGLVGLIVSDVLGIESVEPSAVQMAGSLSHGELPYRGAVNGPGGLSLWLDIERIAAPIREDFLSEAESCIPDWNT